MNRPRILLVDDSTWHIDLIQQAIATSKRGLDVTVTRTTTEALAILQQNQHLCPDHILLDIGLPDGNGVDLIRAVRSDPNIRPIPMTVFTSTADEELREEAYRAGANSYLLKPVNRTKFMEKVLRHLDYWFDVAERPPRS